MSTTGRRSEVVFKHPHRRACGEPQLVLASAGISSDLVHRYGAWNVLVAATDESAALHELNLHQQDHAQTNPPRRKLATFTGATTGVFSFAVVISLMTFCDLFSAYQLPWRESGRMSPGDVIDGQWWRVFTALTLHADLYHAMSNLAFGGLFGWMAGRVLGGGVAWASITVAGGIGNGLNAVLRDTDHLSIGASTAVFAALGILVAHALRLPMDAGTRLLKRWSPPICGSLLLALVGVGGERTDVGAHVTGFVCGCALGWLVCRIPARNLRGTRLQTVSGIGALVLVAGSWMIALWS